MDIRDNYKKIIINTLEKISQIRNNASRDDVDDYAQIALDRRLFQFGGDDAGYYRFILEESEELSRQMVFEIIAYILHSKQAPVKAFIDNGSRCVVSQEGDKRILYIFKDFGLKSRLPNQEIKRLLDKYNAIDYMFVSFIWDHAYMETFNHNDNVADPSRGGKNIGVADFLVRYIYPEEVELFIKDIEDYELEVNTIIGMGIMKTLQPMALYRFKRVTNAELLKFKYKEHLIDVIPEKYHNSIRKQFVEKRLYTVLTGDEDCAESFITAEWLFKTFGNAGKIDYTVVAMGYFKAIEQLLYKYILLHVEERKGKSRTLKRKVWKKDKKYLEPKKDKNGNNVIHKRTGEPVLVKTDPVVINQENVDDGRLDTSLGPMINSFFCNRDNKDLIREIIDDERIIESIYSFLGSVNPLRNGYFHKHNLDKWEQVVESRNLAFKVAYLVLGTYVIDEDDYSELGVIKENDDYDYYRLCEYMMDHPRRVYFMDIDGSGVQPFTCKVEVSFDKTGKSTFGDIKLFQFKKREHYSISKKTIPTTIYSTNLNVFDALEGGMLSLDKLISGKQDLIYDGGFCAPVQEEILQY